MFDCANTTHFRRHKSGFIVAAKQFLMSIVVELNSHSHTRRDVLSKSEMQKADSVEISVTQRDR
jgi:hypothetical protein